MALANANSTLAAEQQDYENWKEGGASRVWAHALVGGLAGNLQGAAGAALASAAAPVIDELTRDLPSGVKEAVGAGLAGGLGATAGGAAGATTAFNADVNNRQSNAAQRDALARLQKNKGEADQKKLADAMCALLKCAAGADPNSAGHAAKVSSQNRGTDYKDEQQLLLKTGVFSEYGWSDGAIDIASTLLHNAKDGMQGAASGAGYLGNAVANDFKSAVAAANPPDIPPDIDSGGKPPAAGGGAVLVGMAPTVWCAVPPTCVPGFAPVAAGGRLGYAPENWALSTGSGLGDVGTSNGSASQPSGKAEIPNTETTQHLSKTPIDAKVRTPAEPVSQLLGVSKAVNSNLPHAIDRGVERGVFTNKLEAGTMLRDLSNQISRNGFPKGTTPDSHYPDRLLVPVGNNGYAVYQVRQNGTAVLKTILNAR